MKKIALIARGLSKNGVRSFIETDLAKYNLEKKENFFVFTDEKNFVFKYPNLEVVYISKTNKLIWDNLLLTINLLKNQIDEVIYTKNIIPLFHLFLPFKKIIYVLDLAFKYPKLKAYKIFDTLYMNVLLGISLKFADKVIAISQFTKGEILKFYPKISEQKIVVEHLAISSIFKKIVDQEKINKIVKKYGLKLPFIFYCGSISPRKNILNLLKSFQAIQNKIPHQLYLLSSRWWNSDKELEIIKKNGNKKIQIIKDVVDEDLAVFYSIADLFVYPSLYEGYGLPIKEAEACGCKVLCSDIPTSLEIAKKSHFFSLSKKENFSKKIMELLK
ncbi:glycosyltransferase family 4 protein [Patescibacteria group bacterium]|nr:glycosyltransferase family 4 protein [Patescibacteria group bacterium]